MKKKMKKYSSLSLLFLLLSFCSCDKTGSLVLYLSLEKNSYIEDNKYTNSGYGSLYCVFADELNTPNYLNLESGFARIGEIEKIELQFNSRNKKRQRTIICKELPLGYSILLKNKYGAILKKYNSVGNSFNFYIKDIE